MKRIYIIPALAIAMAFLFSSCSKTDNGGYSCQCTYTRNGVGQTLTVDMHSQTKAYATSDCKYEQAYLQANDNADAACHL